MNKLVIKGNTVICGMEVPKISGGFGPGRPVMLAKTIAELHEMQLKHVNEAINANRKRFKDGVDVIDLKNSITLSDPLSKNSVDQIDPLLVAGILSKQSIANSENIYLCSQRGYAKLLKIFNDDLAWERYDQIISEYFEMKERKPKLKPMAQFNRELKLASELAFQASDNKTKARIYRAFADSQNLEASFISVLETLPENNDRLLPTPGGQVSQAVITPINDPGLKKLNSFLEDVLSLIRFGEVDRRYIQIKTLTSGELRGMTMLLLWTWGIYEIWAAKYFHGNRIDYKAYHDNLIVCLKKQPYYGGYIDNKIAFIDKERHRPHAFYPKRLEGVLLEILKMFE
jgi:hypothetical protein